MRLSPAASSETCSSLDIEVKQPEGMDEAMFPNMARKEVHSVMYHFRAVDQFLGLLGSCGPKSTNPSPLRNGAGMLSCDLAFLKTFRRIYCRVPSRVDMSTTEERRRQLRIRSQCADSRLEGFASGPNSGDSSTQHGLPGARHQQARRSN